MYYTSTNLSFAGIQFKLFTTTGEHYPLVGPSKQIQNLTKKNLNYNVNAAHNYGIIRWASHSISRKD